MTPASKNASWQIDQTANPASPQRQSRPRRKAVWRQHRSGADVMAASEAANGGGCRNWPPPLALGAAEPWMRRKWVAAAYGRAYGLAEKEQPKSLGSSEMKSPQSGLDVWPTIQSSGWQRRVDLFPWPSVLDDRNVLRGQGDAIPWSGRGHGAGA